MNSRNAESGEVATLSSKSVVALKAFTERKAA